MVHAAFRALILASSVCIVRGCNLVQHLSGARPSVSDAVGPSAVFLGQRALLGSAVVETAHGDAPLVRPCDGELFL